MIALLNVGFVDVAPLAQFQPAGTEVHVQFGVVLPVAAHQVPEELFLLGVVVALGIWQFQWLRPHQVGGQRHATEVIAHPGHALDSVDVGFLDDTTTPGSAGIVLPVVLEVKPAFSC